MSRIHLDEQSSLDDVARATTTWADEHVPAEWREAAARGGHDAIRQVRTYADYEAWYPTFADSGLAVATWPVPYGGLDLTSDQARVANDVLAPFNLGRLNIIALGAVAPALFTYGTDEQCRRFLPPMVRNEEKWTQLLSEPGAGSDLASVQTFAQFKKGEEKKNDKWIINGHKV